MGTHPAEGATSESGGWRGEAPALVAVLVLTLAALWLRMSGIAFALPCQQEPDPHILGQIETLSQAEVSDRDLFFTSIYPHLIARLSLLTGAEPVTGAPTQAPLEDHLRAASALHVHVRRVVAWLSVLLIPATYWLCRQFQKRGPALFAAALAATSLMSLQFGQQARPHAAVASFVALAVAAAVQLRRRPSALSFGLFGVFFALALACLTNAAAVVLAALPAYALRERVAGLRRWLDPLALLPLTLVALSFKLFWPFLFVEAPPEAAASSGAPEVVPSSGPLVRFVLFGALFGLGVLGVVADWLRERSSPRLRFGSLAVALAGAVLLASMRSETLHIAWQTIKLSDFSGGGFPLLFATLWYYEPVALVLCGVGVVAWFATPRVDPTRAGAKDLLVVLAFAVTYALVIGLFDLNQQRFTMPLLAFVYCGAAFGMQALARALDALVGGATARRSTSFAAGLALATGALASVGYVKMRARPHTLELAANWLREHASPARDSVALHLLYDLPLARLESNLFDESGAPRSVLSPWQHYQQNWMREWSGERWNVSMLYPDRARWPWIAKNAAEYVAGLTVDYVITPGAAGVGANPMMSAVREAVLARGELVASFPAETRPPNSGISGLDTPHFTRFVLTKRWLGPELEIYRLRR